MFRVVLLFQDVRVVLLPENAVHLSVSRDAWWGFTKTCWAPGILFKYLRENNSVFTLDIWFLVAFGGKNNQLERRPPPFISYHSLLPLCPSPQSIYRSFCARLRQITHTGRMSLEAVEPSLVLTEKSVGLRLCRCATLWVVFFVRVHSDLT